MIPTKDWAFGIFAILLGVLAQIFCGICHAQTPVHHLRPETKFMLRSEITDLQRQLTASLCYSGPIDGENSNTLEKSLQACPDPRLSLRIETGMHLGRVNRISADAGCSLLVTGSKDKTTRLWSMPEGRLLRIQRLPIDEGDGGAINAVAITENGKLVAAGGVGVLPNKDEKTFINSIYLFDSSVGNNIRKIGLYDTPVTHLVFSADGARLAVALGSGGVRLVDVASGNEIARDTAYKGSGSQSIAFTLSGGVVAVGIDGDIRLYDRNLNLVKKTKALGGNSPFTVAVNPNGFNIAIGYYDSKTVDLYDIATLNRVNFANSEGLKNTANLGRVAYSRDGEYIYAAGRSKENYKTTIRRWPLKDLQNFKDVEVASNTVFSLTNCGNDIVFGTEDSLGLVSLNSNLKIINQSKKMDGGKTSGENFLVSQDGRQVRFRTQGDDNPPVIFDIKNAILYESPDAPIYLRQAKTSGLAVSDWKNSNSPRFGGKLLVMESNETSNTLAIRENNDGFVLGTSYKLRAFKSTRNWFRNHSFPVNRVNMARGGELVIATYGDGIIRWHRWLDGQELLALFVNKETKAWVAWTPSGYYTASPGGEDMIGWNVNRGWEQPADFFAASKFRDQYARPDIVERVLDTMDEGEAIRLANATRPGKAAPAAPIAERLPPVVSILSPAAGSTVDGDSVRLDYLVRSPSGLPVDAIETLVDGRPATAERGIGRPDDKPDAVKACLSETQGIGRLEGGLQGCRGSITVRLPPGTSEVGLFARSGERAGEVAKLRLARAGAASGEELLKPKLYALVVGVSAYANPDYRLAYAAKDAGDFAAALENQKGGLYAEVTVRRLTDGDASSQSIRKGLDWLTKQVTSRDVGIVYLAGHGMLDTRERFYFLAADSNADELRATAVPREDIADALDGLAGKALLFLDACHSGAIAGTSNRRGLLDINGVVNEFTRSERGVVAFTASTGRQVSQENAAWGNGAFTKAVVEALGAPGVKPAADFRGDGKITTSALDLYVSERVKALTGGAQSPVMIRPATVPDFPLAVAVTR